MAERKNSMKTNQFITNASMTGSVTSDSFDVSLYDNICIELEWTSATAPVGNFQVQGTIVDPATASQWVDILDSAVAAGGAAGTALINVSSAAFTDMRVTYTVASGTATLNGWWFAKAN